MGRKHFLEKAHERMSYDYKDNLWLPGCTTWRHYTGYRGVSESTIRKAQRDGYLTKNTGIPALTKKGYLKF